MSHADFLAPSSPLPLRRFGSFLLLALALAAPLSAQAIVSDRVAHEYDGIELNRLIDNLGYQIARDPDNLTLRAALARAHALVFALQSKHAELDSGTHEPVVLAGQRGVEYYHPVMPLSVPQSPGPDARAHLAHAIELYNAVLNVPTDSSKAIGSSKGTDWSRDTYSKMEMLSAARLGRGWCLEQSGDRQAAIADYRALVRQTWADLLPGRRGTPVPGRDWTDDAAEAATYLLKLLDPGRDAKEIAALKQHMAAFNYKSMRAITPIAIPLAKDTPLADIEDHDARVAFDADARHAGMYWSWLTPKAGWLAYDPKRTGKIASGIRLFGNTSYWMFWENGYQALSVLDDNHDGVLTGWELDGLVVWVDENRNGVCDDGEIKTLGTLNIKALRYSHAPVEGHPDHIVYSPQGVLYNDGTSGPSYDIILHQKP